MKLLVCRAVAGAMLLLVPAQASAALVSITYSGVVGDCPGGCSNVSKDYADLFGLGPGASLVGEAYEAVFVLDTSRGNLLTDANSTSLFGGTQYGVPTPLVSATLFLNGRGASIPGDTVGAAFNLVNPPGFLSQVSHSAQSLCTDASCATYVYKVFNSYVANTTGGGWSNSVLTPFDYAVAAGDNLTPSFNFFEIIEGDQVLAVAWLVPSRVTSSVVPLPAASPLLGAALGVLGCVPVFRRMVQR